MSKYPGLIKAELKKMRYLKLDAQMYEILYGNLINSQMGMDKYQVRLHAKILDKIELCGNLQEDGSYKLISPTTLHLEDAEYKHIELINDGMKFNPRFAREAVKYLDWFVNAPTKPPLEVSNEVPESDS